ncbi:hypothetical protein SAMN05519104_6815 [Rhizobiales bacterium GAS188]|jgi:hypothetical protein|nr:hypothetical protein SAMN05519104_6815 [Rhizobiales bacterium GAS188]
MADPRNREDENAIHSIAVARLVNGILDGTYTNIDNAQIALERSRRRKLLLKRKSNLGSQPTRSGDSELSH